ncbi:MAG: UbiH/UbiF/VisC/COQ6 family ubiquinone biosynthesis hydroxylase [Congregibacter sp.]
MVDEALVVEQASGVQQAPVDVDIAIVGGGIAGLAAGAALAEQGLSIAVLEARSLPAQTSLSAATVEDYDARVSALTPHSVRFLDRLGAWRQMQSQRICDYQHMTVWDADGTARIEFDAAEVAANSLGAIVENSVISAALAARIQSLSDVRVLAPATLSSVQAEPGGHTLRLDSGERLRCKLLIAADGALSPVRSLLGFATREWDYGHRAIVTTAAFERGHQSTAWQRFLQSGPLALLPLESADSRFCSIVWSIDEAKADSLIALDDSAFSMALAAASEYCLGDVVAVAPRRAFPLRQRHAVDYVRHGVALVGDAAHTIHPLAGQGINLGLADVEVLADEVCGAWARGLEPGREDVLKRYQRRRKSDNLAMMAAMDGFKRLFEQDAPPLRWLRNAGMRGVASMPVVKRRIIRHAMGVA